MGIDDLENLIRAKENQMGIKITEETQQKEDQNSPKDNGEVVEIMKLLFEYLKKSVGSIKGEIATIKEQQQKILEIIDEKEKE